MTTHQSSALTYCGRFQKLIFILFAGSVSRLRGDDDDIEDKPALNMSVSTVRSTSPIQDVVSTQSAR